MTSKIDRAVALVAVLVIVAAGPAHSAVPRTEVR